MTTPGKKSFPPNDPDTLKARAGLDAEFPGALLDDSLVRFMARKERLRQIKKRLIPALAKFFAFIAIAFYLTAGSFPLSFLDSLTVAAGAAVFAVLPLRVIFKELVKGQRGQL